MLKVVMLRVINIRCNS